MNVKRTMGIDIGDPGSWFLLSLSDVEQFRLSVGKELENEDCPGSSLVQLLGAGL